MDIFQLGQINLLERKDHKQSLLKLNIIKICLKKRKKKSFAATWLDLKIIILGVLSQTNTTWPHLYMEF